MTKEELKNDAMVYAHKKFNEEQAYLHDIIAQTYLAAAEPREKRIAELEKVMEDRLRDVLKDNTLVNALLASEKRKTAQLEQENNRLKAQIKKMRMCANCSKWLDCECEEPTDVCDNWKMKE